MRELQGKVPNMAIGKAVPEQILVLTASIILAHLDKMALASIVCAMLDCQLLQSRIAGILN